jgi:hypothetical protein
LTRAQAGEASSGRACAFCGRKPPEVKMSKEHVVRSALRKHLPHIEKPHQTQQQFLDPSDGKFRTREHVDRSPNAAFNMVVRHVCKPCNEGWLVRSVERPVEQLLGAMLTGTPALISKSDSEALGLWAAKTAAMRALMDPGMRFIPEDHYHHIRDRLQPPPGTFAWAASLPMVLSCVSRHVRLALPLRTVLAHVTTFYYGHLAIFVVGVSEGDSSVELPETVARLDALPTLRLWPNALSSRWPLPPLAPAMLEPLSRQAEGMFGMPPLPMEIITQQQADDQARNV